MKKEKKGNPPAGLGAPDGYRFLAVGERIKTGDAFMHQGGWMALNGVTGNVRVDEFETYIRKIEKAIAK